jgi:hypothetical protein
LSGKIHESVSFVLKAGADFLKMWFKGGSARGFSVRKNRTSLHVADSLTGNSLYPSVSGITHNPAMRSLPGHATVNRGGAIDGQNRHA